MRNALARSTVADIFLTALAPMIWGSTYIVTSTFLPPDRPFTAALIRVLPAGLLLVALFRTLPPRGQWGKVMVLSLLNIGAFQALLFVAAYRLPGGVAAVVGAIQPLLVMLLSWSVDRRQPAVVAILAALAGVAGMALLLLSPNAQWETVGVLAAFGGACSMALGAWLMRRWQVPLPAMAMTGWQLLLGGVMLAPLAWWQDAPLPALTPVAIAGYVWLCVAGALIAYGLWFRGITRLPSEAVTALGLLSPVTAVVLGWIFLHQALRGSALAGLLIVLISVVVIQRASVQPRVSAKKP
ncbi:EamA family transporter [Enterobacterales bacterium CwR94]|nr:EamA family transporter [Enterobacterales bacterium CwR94]